MKPQLPEGIVVKIRYYRVPQYIVTELGDRHVSGRPQDDHLHPAYPKWSMPMSPRGGKTVARLVYADTGATVAMGEAHCSLKDVFCRKVGRDIALGRALKSLKEQGRDKAL